MTLFWYGFIVGAAAMVLAEVLFILVIAFLSRNSHA